MAALRIIGDEVRQRGVCALYVEEIAARAGTCRSTVKNAMREAQRRGLLLRVERRRAGQGSLTNVMRIISREWIAWLRLGNTAVKKITTTDIRHSKKAIEAVDNSVRHVAGHRVERRSG